MTDEFRELTSRLAKGLNFNGGLAVLITKDADSTEYDATLKGNLPDIMAAFCYGIDLLFNMAIDEEARSFREVLKKIIILDEERRFRSSTIDGAEVQ